MRLRDLSTRLPLFVVLAGSVSAVAWAQSRDKSDKAVQCVSGPVEAKTPDKVKITSVAKAKNLEKLRAVDESDGACVPGAINRGIRLLVGEIKWLTDAQFQDYLIAQFAADSKTQCNALKSTDPVPQNGTKKRGCDGTVTDFKRVKDKIVKDLLAKGVISQDIETTAVEAKDMKPSEFLQKAAAALKEGAAVEMQVEFADKNVTHISIAGEIVMAGSDYGVALYDDTVQADKTASAALRGTYFFPDSGGCYFWSQVDGQKKTPSRKLVGMLIQKKKPAAAK